MQRHQSQKRTGFTRIEALAFVLAFAGFLAIGHISYRNERAADSTTGGVSP